jgi:transmembrane sensor
MALADTARFVGEAARAQQALLALRRRFGAKGYSAFLLGRINADQLSSPGQGVQWFETYLQEEPNGSLAEQALGRILDIQRHGSPEVARQAADRYLARYPNGAYAALARSVLAP